MAYKTVPKYFTTFKYKQKRLPDLGSRCILFDHLLVSPVAE